MAVPVLEMAGNGAAGAGAGAAVGADFAPDRRATGSAVCWEAFWTGASMAACWACLMGLGVLAGARSDEVEGSESAVLSGLAGWVWGLVWKGLPECGFGAV